MNIQIISKGQTMQVGNADLNNGIYNSYRKDKMWKFNGFAISKQILDYLKAKQCHTVVCSGLNANLQDFFDYGNKWINGNDEQLVLNMDFWRK